jgi:hypothetical protein
MDGFLKELFKKYGGWALVFAALGFAALWLVTHFMAAPGGRVSVLWGLVDYPKKGTLPSWTQSEPDKRKSKADESIAAKRDHLFPVADGNDVLVPHLLIEAIKGGFDQQKPVYAATDLNGWLRSGKQKATPEALRLTTMVRDGSVWRARDMTEKRFHPAQLFDPALEDPFYLANVAWAQIENVYNLEDPFVDMSSGSPCLKVRLNQRLKD